MLSKRNYSGKKKRHTSKILVLSDENKAIPVITPVYVGKSHDFGMMIEEDIVGLLPAKTPVYLDTGFQGIEEV